MKWSCVVLYLLVTRGGAVSDLCLTCLCEAASQCDLKFRCDHDVCGPFKIIRDYWIDGGSLGGGGWETCAMDTQCAVNTVRGYMSKYKKDCDGDGEVDCQDYARMHKLGGVGCVNEPGEDFLKFKRDLDTCLAEVNTSMNSIMYAANFTFEAN
ncbi:lysozyme-like isoform X2 [Zootermopsis nevadensis]|uniref:lysozyme-like isoform X2 n=1 Tax=Zootermopsis nevadensis TaxID=136037 RepID=UPI000B8E5E8B|nr:lysozyme-like isoform X2 [Zootermopsis nevadensis]